MDAIGNARRVLCLAVVAGLIGLWTAFLAQRDAALADSAEPYRQSLLIDRPVAEVWQALTEKRLVDLYYLAPLGADIGAAGSEIYYGLPDQKMILGEVRRLEAPQLLEHSFRFAFGAPPEESLVTYRLEPEAGGTRLTLEHSGFEPDSQSYADISGGWPIILGNLKALLEGPGGPSVAETP